MQCQGYYIRRWSFAEAANCLVWLSELVDGTDISGYDLKKMPIQ
jgi:hypothetical protein